MRFLTGFASLADEYDGFVLDLWGVIHDGVNAFPHAVDCLAQLRDAGKKTLLLSNVPRPNDAVRTMMRRMGIEDAHYRSDRVSARGRLPRSTARRGEEDVAAVERSAAERCRADDDAPDGDRGRALHRHHDQRGGGAPRLAIAARCLVVGAWRT